MRFAVAALALSLAVPAHAGGLGVLGTAGVHTETVYYHTDHAYLDELALAVVGQIEDPTDRVVNLERKAQGGVKNAGAGTASPAGSAKFSVHYRPR